MKHQQQLAFEKIHWKHRYCSGGVMRNKRSGRRARPLSSKQPLHLVFKANRECIPSGLRAPRRFALLRQLLKQYSSLFFIKIEQIGVEGDHFHLLIRFSKRSNLQYFLRVLAGQIAQRYQKEGLIRFVVTDTHNTQQKAKKLWKYRPFSRVVIGWKAYKAVAAYVRLNEKEGSGLIPYRKQRLKALSSGEWQILLV